MGQRKFWTVKRAQAAGVEVIGDIELFAVTEEKAPGVVASTQEPIMAGTV